MCTFDLFPVYIQSVMKLKLVFFIAGFILYLPNLKAQKTYSSTVTEFIFSSGNVQFTDAFLSQYPDAKTIKTDLRFTAFFHICQDWHIDFTNNIGVITGLGLRNVGLISDEVLPDPNNTSSLLDYKIIRRLYTLGVPLAFKLGSFKDHIFFYGGGELEMALHYKEKYWTNTHSRKGDKAVYTSWFGEQTPLILPSVFGGIQLPKGINIKVKYYINNFLSNSYKRSGNDNEFNVSDLTRYKKSQVFYLALSMQFNTAYITKKDWKPEKEEVVAYY